MRQSRNVYEIDGRDLWVADSKNAAILAFRKCCGYSPQTIVMLTGDELLEPVCELDGTPTGMTVGEYRDNWNSEHAGLLLQDPS